MLTTKRLQHEQAIVLEFIKELKDELASQAINFDMYRYDKNIHTYKTNKATEKQYYIHSIYYRASDIQEVNRAAFKIAHRNNKIDLHGNNDLYISLRIYK